MERIYDMIVIGGGPAGLSAGIYGGRAKLDVLIIEKENIEINVRSAYLNVLSLEKQIASQSKALEVAKVNFELNQEKYDAGLISTVDYLDFENTYRQARIAYNKVLLDYYYAFETYRSLLI